MICPCKADIRAALDSYKPFERMIEDKDCPNQLESTLGDRCRLKP